MRKNRRLVANSLRQARRDIRTARTLANVESFDWALAVSYNAMLLAGRAVMFSQGYRPSSRAGHVAVVKFLDSFLGVELGERMVLVLDRMRKKRHRVIYDEMDIVSRREAEQALKWAAEFVERATKATRARIDRPVRVKARRAKWGKEAFPSARGATFGD